MISKAHAFTSIYIALLLFIGLAASCKKNTDSNTPNWFRASQYSYDLETDTSSFQNRILLNVSISSEYGIDRILLDEFVNDTGEKKYSNVIQLSINRWKPDGLYCTASNHCSFGFFSDVFEYKVIPANPAEHESIPQYGCEHSDRGHNQVLNPDTVITVPAGTYHVFCLQQANGDISYWNRDLGIIQYEHYQNDRAFPHIKLVTMKLRAVE